MEPTITPPEGYRATRMKLLWARADCPACLGGGEVLVYELGEPGDSEQGPRSYPQPCDCLWTPEPVSTGEIDAEGTGEQQCRQHIQPTWADVRAAIGPRRVGGRYWDGHRRRHYIVDAVYTAGRPTDSPPWWIGVLWEDGCSDMHSVPWSPDAGDRVSPRPPTPSASTHRRDRCRRCRSRSVLVRVAHRLRLL